MPVSVSASKLSPALPRAQRALQSSRLGTPRPLLPARPSTSQQRGRRQAAPRATALAAAPVAVAAMAAAPVLFTPVASLLGGLTLGLVSFWKLNVTGRVLGISGAVRGLACGSQEAWRVAFLTGLLAGGLVLQALLPGSFEVLPAAYSLSRALLAGLLVGLGTARGSGCTSGHGIAGIARLSLRSVAATAAFMASGVLTAYLAGTAAVFGLPSGIAPMEPLSLHTPAATFGLAVLALAIVSWLGLSAAARALTAPARAPTAALLKTELHQAALLEKADIASPPPPARPDAQKLAALSTAADLFAGLLFALGLGVSGMLLPSKVAGFLSVLSGSFDPSLMAVMGGALLVALPAYQAMLRAPASRPLCADCFDLPSKKVVDGNLVGGALLFGAGLGGICPGPGLVALVTLQPQVLVFVAAMVAGMQLDRAADTVTAKLLGLPAKA